jgi:hypothetical protein
MDQFSLKIVEDSHTMLSKLKRKYIYNAFDFLNKNLEIDSSLVDYD